ncbi:MAG: hypothetical protein ACYS0G_05840 [Planctomycetota bacterium]|jgi:hypothetical protein
MSSDQILVVNLLLSTVAFSLIAKWYVMPRLRSMEREQALQPLLLLHTFRHIGLMFLASGALTHELAGPFAYPAAFGDLAASILAFASLVALRLRWPLALPLVWIFNIEGTIDLLYALVRGFLHQAASGMGAAFWIPAILVPALLVTHSMVFTLLLQCHARGSSGS